MAKTKFTEVELKHISKIQADRGITRKSAVCVFLKQRAAAVEKPIAPAEKLTPEQVSANRKEIAVFLAPGGN
jgi:hypothetical protein